MSETIRRVAERTKNYTTMMNEALKRPDLSARAKGIYAYLMTLPNDWIIRKEELQRHFTEGREAIDKAFKELVTAGYVTLKIERDEKRQISGYAYSIHELCIPEEQRTLDLLPRKLVTGNPETAFPEAGNPQLLSTDLVLTTEKPKTDKISSADLALSYLNEKTGSKFRSHKGTGLTTLISQGVTIDTIKAVIDRQVLAWKGTEFAQYLTPSTLFRVSKFEQYENALRFKPNQKANTNNKRQFGFETFDPSRDLPDEIPM